MKESHALDGLVEPVNKYIQDPLAQWMVEYLKHTEITPNQVTYFSVLTGFASGYAFSFSNSLASTLGGLLLEITLLLDCVDGQLARTKGLASKWGRLIDGIAGYFAYLAVVWGIIEGFPEHAQTLKVIGALVIMRAISYDYCKQSLGTLILKGYDGMEREIQNTRQRVEREMSWVLVIYFYYMQVQQLFFRGKWTFLHQVKTVNMNGEPELTAVQRIGSFKKVKVLLWIWSWNGLDLPLFLLALFAILGILSSSLIPFLYVMSVQFLLTLMAHYYFVRKV